MRFKNQKTAWSIIALSIIVILLGGLLIGKHRGTESVRKQPLKTEPQKGLNSGGNVIFLNGAAQNKAGIVVSSLQTVFHQEEIQAYGTVLQPKALMDMRNSYIEARASTDRAHAASEASRKEYERLKTLNADNKNISDKVLESAGAAFSADEATASASREKLQSVRDAAVLQWGREITGWVFASSPAFQRLIDMKEVLIQITLPLDVHIEIPPGTISIQSQAALISARLIARVPVADPRTQGMSFFYVAQSYATRLLPGMNVQALLSSGPQLKGFVIPVPSVVWLNGKAWAYCRTDEEHFARREVSTLNPVRDGYFVSENFRSGDQIVIKGAQVLLSEEILKVQNGGGGKKEEGDED